VDRRQVHDVETELRELREHAPDACEAAPRPREELVPRAEGRELAVDVHFERLGPRLLAPVARLRGERLRERERLAAEEHRTLGELGGQVVLARVVFALNFAVVRSEAIDPRLDPVAPAAGRVDLEAAREAVVPDGLEPRLPPARRPGCFEAHGRTEHFVAVAHDRRPHLDALADDALHRKAPAVDLGLDRLDEDAARRIARFG
jgi:hypothetical protein